MSLLVSARDVTSAFLELKNFIRSKKIKREPVRRTVKGVACASCCPRNLVEFRSLRNALRISRDFGRASERLDALEAAFVKKHQHALPLPNELVQNEDCSISIFYDGVSVRAFPDDIAYLVGGAAGQFERGIKPLLLKALAFQAHLQSARKV